MPIVSLFSRVLGGVFQRDRGDQSSMPSLYSAPAAIPDLNSDTALQIPAVWACIRIISEAVSLFPARMYDVSGEGRVLVEDHPLARLLRGPMNSWQTPSEFFEVMAASLALQGNAYARIMRNQGRLIGLEPLSPSQMQVELEDGGLIAYKYTENARERRFLQRDILHIRRMGNGVIGLSPISYMRNTLGLSAAVENLTSDIFSHGGRSAAILSFPGVLKPEQREMARQNLEGLSDKNKRFFVLENGVSYHGIGMAPQDIQLLSARKFNVEDIARIFGVPSALINDSGATSNWGSGIESLVQAFYKFSLRGYLNKLETGMQMWLLRPEERSRYIIEFDPSALLRMDFEGRVGSLTKAIIGGLLSPNEARARENLPPVENGDSVIVQAQMTPLGQETGDS